LPSAASLPPPDRSLNSEGGYEHAREHPAVLAIWGPMDALLEDRGGQPKWEFPHYQRVSLGA
jgi:hypothetical protein